MNRFRVGVIGLGVGEQHIKGYLRHAACDVKMVCDLSASKLAAAKSNYPAVDVSSKEDDVLLNPEIDIVSIASFDNMHAGQVLKALKAGKHVFVEKPLCQNFDELQLIKSAWQAHKGRIKLASNLVLRTAPAYRWLKKKVESGEMGTIYAFDGDYLYGRLHKITEGWRKDINRYSVMAGGGIHLIDLMLWITGQRPQAVHSEGNRICSEGTAFRYPDYVQATFRCPSGLVARISANFGCVQSHQHAVRVFGTRGTFWLDDAGGRWHTSRDPGVAPVQVKEAAKPASKAELIGPFIDAIRNDWSTQEETQTYFDGLSMCIGSDLSLAAGVTKEVPYA